MFKVGHVSFKVKINFLVISFLKLIDAQKQGQAADRQKSAEQHINNLEDEIEKHKLTIYNLQEVLLMLLFVSKNNGRHLNDQIHNSSCAVIIRT